MDRSLSSPVEFSEEEMLARHLLKSHEYGRFLVEGLQKLFSDEGLSDDPAWLPAFHESKALPRGDWSLVLIKTTDDSGRRIVSVQSDNEELLKALNFFKQQFDNLKLGFEIDADTQLMRPKLDADEAELKKAGFSISSVTFLNNLISSKDVQSVLNRDIRIVLDMWAFVSTIKYIEILSLNLSVEGFILDSYYGFVVGEGIGKGTAAWTTLVMLVKVGLLLHHIQMGDQVAIAGDINSIAFGVLSTGLNFTALLTASTTVAAFASALNIPLMGLEFGVGALWQNIVISIETSLASLKHLYAIYWAYKHWHGYKLDDKQVMIPIIDANIECLDFRTGKLHFGDTKLMGNKGTPMKLTQKFINMREDSQACPAIVDLPRVKTKDIVLVLPQGGDVYIKYTTAIPTGFGLRGDAEFEVVRKLKGKFEFVSGINSVSKLEIKYVDKTVKYGLGSPIVTFDVYLDSYKRTVAVMPPKGAYRESNEWKLKYELIGNGGDYVLVVNSKPHGPAEVWIEEDGPKQSQWLITAGKDEPDDIREVESNRFKFGDVWLNLPEKMGVVVMSNKLLFKVGNGKKTLIGVNSAWLSTKDKLLPNLAVLTSEYKVENLLVSELNFDPVDGSWLMKPLSEDEQKQFIKVSGIYNGSTKDIHIHGWVEGWIYQTKYEGAQVVFWGVDDAWVQSNWGPDFFKKLNKCPWEKGNVKTIYLQNFTIRQFGEKKLSASYRVGDDSILGTAEDGVVFRITRDLRAKIVGFHMNHLKIPLSTVKDRIFERAYNKNLSRAPIISVTGSPDDNKLWYMTKENRFIVGPPGSTYIGRLDKVHLIFSENFLYSQVGTPPEETPKAPNQVLEHLGKISDELKISASGILTVTTLEDDLTFKVSHLHHEEVELIDVGTSCELSWEHVLRKMIEEGIRLAEVVCCHSPKFWWHRPSNTKFSPTEVMLNANWYLPDFVYLGYQSNKAPWNTPAIYLFSKSNSTIFSLSADGRSFGKPAIDAFRLGNVLAITGHAWELEYFPTHSAENDDGGIQFAPPRNWNSPENVHQMLIDDVETLVLRVNRGSYPTLIWPEQLGFSKTIFEVPEDEDTASRFKVVIKGATDLQHTDNALQVTTENESKNRLFFMDITEEHNGRIYKKLMLDIHDGDVRSALEFYTLARRYDR